MAAASGRRAGAGHKNNIHRPRLPSGLNCLRLRISFEFNQLLHVSFGCYMILLMVGCLGSCWLLVLVLVLVPVHDASFNSKTIIVISYNDKIYVFTLVLPLITFSLRSLSHRMKHMAAYLMLVLGGNENPTADDISKALSSVGVETDSEQLGKLISELEGKELGEVLASGEAMLAKFGSGGGGGGGGGGELSFLFIISNHHNICSSHHMRLVNFFVFVVLQEEVAVVEERLPRKRRLK